MRAQWQESHSWEQCAPPCEGGNPLLQAPLPHTLLPLTPPIAPLVGYTCIPTNPHNAFAKAPQDGTDLFLIMPASALIHYPIYLQVCEIGTAKFRKK